MTLNTSARMHATLPAALSRPVEPILGYY